MLSQQQLLEDVISFQNCLVSSATGTRVENEEYVALWRACARNADVKNRLPDFARTCRTSDQWWVYIKAQFPTWAERRAFIYDAFHPVLDYLESGGSPAVDPISNTIAKFNAEHVNALWQKALDRRYADPEGAVTAARSLVESVCKHILDDAAVSYSSTDDMNDLWKKVADLLKLSPQLHQETSFRSILGNCQAVVNGLANVRNEVGDGHGKGRQQRFKVASRHAELAVNLAGTMAAFLIATWEEKTK